MLVFDPSHVVDEMCIGSVVCQRVPVMTDDGNFIAVVKASGSVACSSVDAIRQAPRARRSSTNMWLFNV